MIVDCAIYHEGRREDVSGDLGDALARARSHDDAFVWIGLHEPSTDEFDLVAKEFPLHPLAVEDSVHAHQRPKLERYGDSLFVVLKTLRYIEQTSDIETGEIMVFLGDRFVLTVRHGGGSPLGAVRNRLEGDQTMLALGPSAVVYAVCDEVVDTYEAIAREVETDIADVEQRVFSPGRTSDAEIIYSLKREVIEFRRAVVPLVEPMRLLTEGMHSRIRPETRPLFRDVYDHVLRVSGDVAAFDDLLTSVLNANLAQVTVRQNEDMRRISAWVAILAVPTVIAGIYGMNFEHMPELHWTFGYPAVLVFMLAVCVTLYRFFRRSGWLLQTAGHRGAVTVRDEALQPYGEVGPGRQVWFGQRALGRGVAAERAYRQPRLGVGHREDRPAASELPGREDQRGRAGVDRDVQLVQLPQQPLRLGRGILDPPHGQRGQGVHVDPRRRRPREVVGEHRHVAGRVHDGRVIVAEPAGPGRRQREHRVGAAGGRVRGIGGGLPVRRRTRPRDDRNLRRHCGAYLLDERRSFVRGQRGRLTGRAGDHDPPHPLVDQPLRVHRG